MGKFNLNQLLNTASMAGNSAAQSEEARRLPLKVVSLNIRDLVPSKNNFYSVENIEELKTSIEIFGVLQNLTVKPLDNGKYEIISGHRRHKACTELVAEGKTEFEYVPCGIQSERDEIKEHILLIMTNSTARELTDWEKMKQAEELRKNFEILKKRENLPGRVRDLVAEALNTSSTQIARLSAIDNNLTPEFKEEFKEGRIGTSAAYELSGMSEKQQKQAYSDYKEKGGVSAKEVKEEERQTDQFKASMNAVAGATEQAPTPVQLDECETSISVPPERCDFADLNKAEKATAAIEFLKGKRPSLFAPGEDMRIFDFIVEVLESHANEDYVISRS